MKRQTKPKQQKAEVGNKKSSRDVTDRTRYEETLLASELKYRRLFEAAKDGILILDYKTGAIVDVNPFLIQFLGLRQEELLGKKIWELGFFKDIAANQANFLELQQKEFIRYENLALESVNGQRKNVEFVSNVYLVNSHKVIQCNIRDITDRKRAEESQRTAEADYRAIFEGVPVGVFQSTPQGRYRRVNPAMARIYGYDSPEEMLASITDISHQIYVNSSERQEFQRILAEQGEVFEFIAENYRKDQTIVWTQTTARAVKDAQGNVLWYEGSSIDITQRKRAEEALRASEAKFRAVVEQSNDGILFGDANAVIHYRSPSYSRINGFTDEERVGHSGFETAHPDDIEGVRLWWARLIQQPEMSHRTEYRIRHKDGTWRWIETSGQNLLGNPDLHSVVVTSRDITERKRSEEKIKTILRTAMDGFYIVDMEGRILEVNDSYCSIIGYSREELLKMSVKDIEAVETEEVIKKRIQRIIENGSDRFETKHRRKDGSVFPIEASVKYLEDESGNLVVFMRDITERKQAEERLRLSEEQYRNLFNYLPIPAFTKDINGIYTSSNEENLKYWVTNPIGHTDAELLPDDIAAALRANDQSVIKSGEAVSSEESLQNTPMGDRRLISRKVPLRDSSKNIIGILGASLDITERKLAEEMLQRAEEKYRTIFSESVEGIFQSTREGQFLAVNPALAHMWGYDSPEELISSIKDIASQVYVEARKRDEFARLMQENDQVLAFEYEVRCKDGKTMWVSENARAVRDSTGIFLYYEGQIEDITQRKQAEKNVRERLTELQMLYESGLALSQLLPPKKIAQELIYLMGKNMAWHHITIRLYYPENETLELLAFNVPGRMSTAELQATERRFSAMISKVGDGLSGWAVQHSQIVRVGDLSRDPRYAETEPGLHSGLYVPLKVEERVVGVISIESEKPEAFSEADERLTITLANQAAIALENARLHDETLHQVRRLEALHAIDQYITGSFDQRLTLELLLTHTLDQLESDAAVIFLLEPYQRTLQYAVGKGFHTHIIESASLKLDESLAGQAVIERRIIHVSDHEASEPHPALAKLWSEEGMRSMYSIPLIVKGQVKGVLSVYHRKAFTPDPTWINFLETLAGQAAIAVDSMQLFNGLQQANMELTVAYDATIEGWSQAMDLRDKETEGHTKRVTEMSIQLGKTMQLGEEYLVHLRRGALLHDIGKLGVPDHILLKADKLTDEEWQIMKKHPQFAYDMLHSVTYLHRALDIPYCHHEKWDGTGYPRGLMGEQIPLAARIFAIVDVWDALTSDRPYREAWSKPDALKYIREQSGKYFDPQVVDIFLKEFGSE